MPPPQWPHNTQPYGRPPPSQQWGAWGGDLWGQSSMGWGSVGSELYRMEICGDGALWGQISMGWSSMGLELNGVRAQWDGVLWGQSSMGWSSMEMELYGMQFYGNGFGVWGGGSVGPFRRGSL